MSDVSQVTSACVQLYLALACASLEALFQRVVVILQHAASDLAELPCNSSGALAGLVPRLRPRYSLRRPAASGVLARDARDGYESARRGATPRTTPHLTYAPVAQLALRQLTHRTRRRLSPRTRSCRSPGSTSARSSSPLLR